MRTQTLFVALASAGAVLAAAGGAAQAGTIIDPTFVSGTNLNTDTSLGFDPANLTSNTFLTSPVPTGATLAQAQAAVFTGSDVYSSYWETISVGLPNNYFATYPDPTLVFDLGSVEAINDIVLWNGYATKSNQAQGFSLSYSDNGTTFFGAYSNTLAASFTDSVEDAQTFALGAVDARYVAITLTSNYWSNPANPALPGGDRVGLGRVRFYVSAVPEPAIWSTMLLGVLGIGAVMRGARRRHSSAIATV